MPGGNRKSIAKGGAKGSTKKKELKPQRAKASAPAAKRNGLAEIYFCVRDEVVAGYEDSKEQPVCAGWARKEAIDSDYSVCWYLEVQDPETGAWTFKSINKNDVAPPTRIYRKDMLKPPKWLKLHQEGSSSVPAYSALIPKWWVIKG